MFVHIHCEIIISCFQISQRAWSRKMAIWSNLVEWWTHLVVWFHSIFTNKSVEKRAHPPPSLKPKRIRRKEEKRESKLQRRAKKREEALQVPPEQRLLEEQAKRMEEMVDWDIRWAEVGASQGGKPEEDLVKPSLIPCSSDNLSHKEFFDKSEEETSEDVQENSFKSSHLITPSVFSKGQRLRHKEEKRESKRQKRGERKERAAKRATRGGALLEKENPLCQTPLPRTRGCVLEDETTVCNKTERRKRKRQRRAERKEKECQAPPHSKECSTQDMCHSDEADKLYDERAIENTMQLLSGELGGQDCQCAHQRPRYRGHNGKAAKNT